MQDLIAIILGGGQGARLYPLTKHRSKPAVPLAGMYRLIDIPISNCLNSGIRKIWVLTQFNSESLNRHIAQTYHFDMFNKGFVDILAAEQTFDSRDWFQGTADAVRKCFRHFAGAQENILILSGDQLYRMDFRDFFKFHLDRKADVTVATIPVKAEDASGFGILKVDSNSQIVDFVENRPPANCRACRSPRKTAPVSSRAFRKCCGQNRTWPRWRSTSSRPASWKACSATLPSSISARISFRTPSSDCACSASCSTATGPISGPSSRSTRPTST